jgi:hypothetical protein
MSWQVRLGNLDEEIRNFLDKNPEFPAEDEREFVMYAVRNTMQNWVEEKRKADEIEKIVDEKVEERLG